MNKPLLSEKLKVHEIIENNDNNDYKNVDRNENNYPTA